MSPVSEPAELRSETILRPLIVAVVALTMAMAASTEVLGQWSEQGFLPLSFAVHSAQRPLTLITGAALAGMGGLLAWRMTRHAVGWFWLLFAVAWVFVEFSRWVAAWSRFGAGPDIPGYHTIAWLAQPMWGARVVAIVFLLLLYPTGRLPGPGWRPLAWVVALSMVGSTLSFGFLPGTLPANSFTNPWPLLPSNLVEGARALGNWLQGLVFLSMLPAAASVFMRLQDARGVERQQIRWFAVAGLLTGIFFVASPLLAMLVRRQYWIDVSTSVVLLVLALTVMLAILRYRLYDLDLFIRRTLVYFIVTALLISLYLGTVILLQTVLVEAIGRRSQVAVVVSTLAIAVLFNPLRQRVQEAIDGRFFRSRYDAQHVLDAFTQVARDETRLDVLAEELVGIVQATLQPVAVHVWLAENVASVQHDE